MWFTTCLLLSLAGSLFGGSEPLELESPGGEVKIVFRLDERGAPRYGVTFRGKPVILESGLGLDLNDGPSLARGFRRGRERRSEHDGTWTPVLGERSEIPSRYRELEVELTRREDPALRLFILFRAYDEGVAFRYRIAPDSGRGDSVREIVIERERSAFRFPGDPTAWAVYSAQGRYEQTSLSKIKPGCERPLTLRLEDGCYAAVGEAALVDHARMKLAPLAGTPGDASARTAAAAHGIVSSLSGTVMGKLPMTTPWRVILLGRTPAELYERNYLIPELNAPCAISDTSWIRPGKVIREVTLTTQGGKACVDFAASHGLEYVEFDAGWYGHEYDEASDATTVTVDPKRSPGPLDLPEVIRYAASKDVGVLLYVNRRALEKQLDAILPLFRSWGVKGVKYGFVNVGSQRWTAWLHEAVRKAARHELMVDVHDEYRPTGYSRTYPNLMTQEGIAGDETSPSNAQTLTLLFTRMLAGAGDNTICYYDQRVEKNACHAYQLAKAVCIYSPWQFLYWYDRPAGSPGRKGGAGGSRNVIGDEPELTFFAALPTVWDETRVLAGSIGEYAAFARRKGDAWFVGVMNGDSPRTIEVPLEFLGDDAPREARIYRHDENVKTRTHVAIERCAVTGSDRFSFALEARQGLALHIPGAGPDR